MSVLKQDFLPPQLNEQLVAQGMAASVAVQADQSTAETDFLLALAETYPFIKGVVGWVGLCDDDIEAQLAHYAQYPAMKGFRHVVQDEPDPNFMLRPDFMRGIGLLKNYDFTYDILIFHHQFPAALKLLEAFPDQPFVIDHIAKPEIKAGVSPQWKSAMLQAAQHPMAYCKISGMATEGDWQNWEAKDFFPFMDVVFDAFGTNRVMYGSDWPVCLLSGAYGKVKGIVDTYLNQFSAEDRALVMGANAQKFYKL